MHESYHSIRWMMEWVLKPFHEEQLRKKEDFIYGIKMVGEDGEEDGAQAELGTARNIPKFRSPPPRL